MGDVSYHIALQLLSLFQVACHEVKGISHLPKFTFILNLYPLRKITAPQLPGSGGKSLNRG